MQEIIKKLENKVIYIEGEEMLEEAMDLIEGKGITFFLSDEIEDNCFYLIFCFDLYDKEPENEEITFEQFKTIMQ